MHCIRCGEAAEFERVVVGRAERPVFGALCRACERQHLGPLVNGTAAADEDRCCLCPADGVYAVPVWDALGVDEGGEVELLEYTIDGETPRLCRDHFERVTGDAVADADAVRPAHVAADD